MRKKLKCLIDEAVTLLENQGEFFSNANKIALKDVLDHACEVYEGKYNVPFTRNREFFIPRQDEDILFAIEYNTFIPIGGTSKYGKYGLKPALEWFKSRHIMLGDIHKKAADAAKNARELLDKISLGTEIGEYNSELAEMVKTALADIENKSGEELGKAVVKLLDATCQLRHSRILRAEKEPKSHLFFTEKSFEKLKNDVQKDGPLRDVFNHIRRVSDTYTPEQINLLGLYHRENIDYGKLNEEFSLWSRSENVINFVVPKDAKYARIMFTLPSCENETEGLGHIWIDDVNVYSASYGKWPLDNPGFEKGDVLPDGWEQIRCNGNSTIRLERRKHFSGKEKASIYIENPTKNDCGGLINSEDIPVFGDTTNTITFLAKIDGKLKKGLNITVLFKNEQGEEISRFDYLFNRKSALTAWQFLLTAQADAIMYAFTGDLVYAQKAKEQLLFILDDFCQGIEFWMIYNLRPQGDDSYGAVQGGRVISCFASAYMMIKNSGIFSKEEKSRMMSLLEYFIRNLIDLRDRTELSDEDILGGSNNWYTSMASGVGLLMMAMPEFPNASQWLDNANQVLAAQRRIIFNPDGSWPESPRYHNVTLVWQALYAKALLNCAGENLYPDFKKIFQFGLKILTPPYTYYDDMVSFPNFGDSSLSPNNQFTAYGLHCNEVYGVDRQTGRLMYEAWRNGSRNIPDRNFRDEDLIILDFLYPYNEFGESEEKMNLTSMDELSDYGIYLFRKNYRMNNECYCAIMANPRPIGHGHYDQGSFIIYHRNVPMIVDPGIEGYFDSTRDWYLSSSAHATLQFASKFGKKHPRVIDVTKEEHVMTGFFSAQHGWTDTPQTSEVLNFSTSDKVDEITVKIKNPEGEGYHTRTISYYRDTDEYVICDRIEEFSGRVRVSFPVAATSYLCINPGEIYCKGHYDVDVQIEFEKPRNINVCVEWGRGITVCPPVDGEKKLLFVRVETEQKEIITHLRFREKETNR